MVKVVSRPVAKKTAKKTAPVKKSVKQNWVIFDENGYWGEYLNMAYEDVLAAVTLAADDTGSEFTINKMSLYSRVMKLATEVRV